MPPASGPNQDFQDLLRAFVEHDVRFLVVGAHAVAAHGVPRATQDLDLWIDARSDNARRAWHALVSFGAPLSELGIQESDFTRPDIVAQVGIPPNRIDVLTSVTGLRFDDAWESRLQGTVEGVTVPVLGRAALLQNKRASGRHKDLGDVEALERKLPNRPPQD
jgi:hypothetical protein